MHGVLQSKFVHWAHSYKFEHKKIFTALGWDNSDLKASRWQINEFLYITNKTQASEFLYMR